MHPMLTVALLTTAGTWKQPTCILPGEWINKVWYIYTMEYYSATKKNLQQHAWTHRL